MIKKPGDLIPGLFFHQSYLQHHIIEYLRFIEFLAIPGWDAGMPDLDHGQEFRRLDHGYDESKNGLAIEDLRKAAECRGGTLVSDHWDGDLCQQLAWQCKGGHHFPMSPNSVLRGGHWCQECLTFPLYPGSRGT